MKVKLVKQPAGILVNFRNVQHVGKPNLFLGYHVMTPLSPLISTVSELPIKSFFIGLTSLQVLKNTLFGKKSGHVTNFDYKIDCYSFANSGKTKEVLYFTDGVKSQFLFLSILRIKRIKHKCINISVVAIICNCKNYNKQIFYLRRHKSRTNKFCTFLYQILFFWITTYV